MATPPALSELVVYEVEANATVIAELSNLSSAAVRQLAGNLAALYEEGVRILLQRLVGRERRQLMGSYSRVTVSVGKMRVGLCASCLVRRAYIPFNSHSVNQ